MKFRGEYRAKLKYNYDQRHRVVEGAKLSPGDRVWIPELKAEGTVIKVCSHTDLRWPSQKEPEDDTKSS